MPDQSARFRHARWSRARTIRRLQQADRIVERYRRAELEWQLNPTARSAAERHRAWQAASDARQAAPAPRLESASRS